MQSILYTQGTVEDYTPNKAIHYYNVMYNVKKTTVGRDKWIHEARA